MTKVMTVGLRLIWISSYIYNYKTNVDPDQLASSACLDIQE